MAPELRLQPPGHAQGRRRGRGLRGPPCLARGADAGPVVKLRILETTDLHVNIFPYDYYRDAADDTVGLARTATLVKARPGRGEEQPALRQRRPHPGLAARRFRRLSQGHEARRRAPHGRRHERAHYDCGTLGNHEFNYGLDFLQNAIGSGEIPARLRQRRSRPSGDDRC